MPSTRLGRRREPAARSEGAGEATALGRRVAPEGSRITVSRSGGAVVARVSSPVHGPAGLFGRLGVVPRDREAVAAEEPEW